MDLSMNDDLSIIDDVITAMLLTIENGGNSACTRETDDNLKHCHICVDRRAAKYRCPKCSTRTCSVACVTQHKLKSGCDGIRDRTAYKSLGDFTDLDLLSDYRFLEEAGRCVNNAARNSASVRKRSYHHRRFANRPRLPYSQYRLVIECRNRGTRIHIMPDTFKRRRENTTHYNSDEKKLYWRIVWEFPQAVDSNYADDEVAEDCLLGKVLEKYLLPERCSSNDVGQSLAFYHSAGYRGVVPLMRVDGHKSSTPMYFELDFSETIVSNLNGKTIIEFPTITLVLREHIHCYSILEIESDVDESQLEPKLKRNERQQILSEGECSSTSDDD